MNEISSFASEFKSSPNKYIFFIGAGLSMPIFTSWKELLSRLLDEIDDLDATEYDEINNNIKNGSNYLEVLDYFKDKIQSTKFRDILENIFDKNIQLTEIPENYKLLKRIEPKIVISSNYDRIIDILFSDSYKIFTNQNIPESLRSITKMDNTIIKIHGDILNNESMVLTRKDYQNIIFDNEKVKELLKSLMSTHNFIFIGFSMNDPHVSSILENLKVINDGIQNTHTVLLSKESKFKIDSFERRYNVSVITYEKDRHENVTYFLKSLLSNAEVVVGDKSHDQINLDVNDLYDHFESLMLDSGYSDSYININNKKIKVLLNPKGETISELQREIILFLDLIRFKCNCIDVIEVLISSDSAPNINKDIAFPITINFTIDFQVLEKYWNKLITIKEMWKKIDFYQSGSVCESLIKPRQIDFPLNTLTSGVLNE